MRRIATLAAVAAALILTGSARAAEVEVKLLNRGNDGATTVFEPAFVKIALGDTVKFRSADRGHDAASIRGMLPDGAGSGCRGGSGGLGGFGCLEGSG